MRSRAACLPLTPTRHMASTLPEPARCLASWTNGETSLALDQGRDGPVSALLASLRTQTRTDGALHRHHDDAQHGLDRGECQPTSRRKGLRMKLGFDILPRTILTAALIALPGLANAQTAKPNIVIIWGDDIGQSNISAYSHGLMGYQTPNIDRVAKEGMMFTDYYAEQSCTAGRASFITGQSGLRTGLTKVGLPGADARASERRPDDCRTAEAARLCDRTIRQEPSRRPQ